MFYPVESLRRGGRFYLCWVADSWPLRFATITHRQLWSQDIRKICDELLVVMKNESGRPINRFSLRLSSQLLRGLVRLYQRKVTVFVGDLCMINALVMKITNKKTHEISDRVVVRHSELPRLVFEEQVDEENVAERIQNSGHTVANVQDITLKEPSLPENRLHLDDGFGELHPDQPLQLLDRTVEMILVQETSVQHSALELPDISTDKSHDRSRLAQPSAQMEMMNEQDISVFRKSVGEELSKGADLEKEIPEIPEIPLPDLPAPEIVNQGIERAEESLQEHSKANDVREKSLEDLVLEELEEQPPLMNRRKIKNKLIRDEKIKLSSNYIRSRIDNIHVELRCEDSINDIISIYAGANILLNRAAHCGTALHSNLGYTLAHMFARNMGPGNRPLATDKEVEQVVASKPRQSNNMSIHERVDEHIDLTDKRTTEQDISKQIDISYIQETSVQAGQDIMDITDLPTQRILTVSQEKRASEYEPSPKRARRSGTVSYRLNRQLAVDVSATEVDKENDSGIENRQQDAERLTAMLHEAGLVDIVQERQMDIEPEIQITTQKSRRNGSETSETPLGSLDRTKVSLGDSECTTESKRILREEWGTHGTMHKIYACVRRGERPLDVARLLSPHPRVAQRRLVAAKCFASILKLKQYGFIEISKDSNTNEIIDITLGTKIVNRRH